MTRETSSPGIVDIEPITPVGYSERYRSQLLTKAATLTGALALAVTMASTRADAAPNDSNQAPAVPAVPMRSIATASGNLAPAKWTGVLEDEAKQPTEQAALQKMQLLGDLMQPPRLQEVQNHNVYVKESIWASPGQTGPSEEDFSNLENSLRAAQALGYHVCLAVWPFTWGKGRDHLPPPLSPNKRWQYTTLLATIDGRLRHDFNVPSGEDSPVTCWFIGNEPNNPVFWRPQFTDRGTDAAAATYEQLLARSYDTLKKISPHNIVIGGELASHGSDDPHGKRKTHSPETFIRDMGVAYRDSGRTKPIMDIFGFHPYGLNSSESPTVVHSDPKIIGVADYPRLVNDLGQAFDGTAQAGSTLPILYSEYGVESKIPPPQNYRYNHAEPKDSGAVDEAKQQQYYGDYLHLAACQPNVIGAFLFHTLDESNKKGWQSGVYYADGSPKTSQPTVGGDMRSLSSGDFSCNK